MGKGKRNRERHEAEGEAFSLKPWQQKAMIREINAQILASDLAYKLDMDAAVFYSLHLTFGFGKKRLRQFFNAFSAQHNALREHYQLDDQNNTWLCRRLLKSDVGVDVDAWEKELEERNGEKGTDHP